MSLITVNLYQCPDRGPTTWTYAVNIGKGTHKIGYGHNYEAAARLAKAGVKSAERYLQKEQ